MQSLSDMLAEYREQAAGLDIPETPVVCTTCQDLGVIRYAVPVGDPRFGKLMPCPEQDCAAGQRLQQQRVERVVSRSTWAAEYDALSFDSFYALGKMDGKKGAFGAAWKFAQVCGQPFDLATAVLEALGQRWDGLKDRREKVNVMISGGHGLGKTGLAVSAVNALRARGAAVLFLRVKELIREVQDCYGDHSPQSPDDKMQFFASVPVLILDEFNLQNYSRDRLEIIETIMRQRDRDGLPFLATTNLGLDEFYSLWGGQIADVVAKSHWVMIAGDKLRITASEMEVF